MKLSLFDKLAFPILTCSSEICGIYEFKKVEKYYLDITK